MLIPVTRKTFEKLIPPVATGAQYVYCWGKLSNLLRRLLVSVVGILGVILISAFFNLGFEGFQLVVGIIVGLYWLWGPVLWASLRNAEYRKYGYSGFWQGEVLDVYVSEELIGQEETVNKQGELVIVENRERRLNLEVGDASGFTTLLQAPLKREHKAIMPGDLAEMLVLSNRRDLSRISKTSDIYLPDNNIWVSDYPYLQREEFINISRRLQAENLYAEERPGRDRTPRPEPDWDDRGSPGALTRREAYEPPRARRRAAGRRSSAPRRNFDY